MSLIGELAALGTATLWAVGSLLFTFAARRIGAFTLNHARITLAFIILSTVLLATRGTAWTSGAAPWQYGVLALSGWAGLTLGDWAYFGAMVRLGARRATLLMTLAPPFTALLAYGFLHEGLSAAGLLGMGLTLGGVVWVVRERQPSRPEAPGHVRAGVVLGALGSLGQAVGLILSKWGMGTTVDPLAATAVRMGAATLGVWLLAVATGRVGGLRRLLADRPALGATGGATLVGPVFGVWLSLVAVIHTKTGIAATLMATTPVLVLPMVWVAYRERISLRAVGGAVIAVAGVAVLFLR